MKNPFTRNSGTGLYNSEEESIAAMLAQSTDAQRQREFNDAVNAAGPGEAVKVPQGIKIPTGLFQPEPAPKPKRPGDSEPRGYVGIARDVFITQINKHAEELGALDKDIEKLSEERRQLRITIDAMQAALEHMEKTDSGQGELRLDEELLAAEIDKHVFGDK